MPAPPAPSASTVLLRGWRQRCPACGVGPVFKRGLHIEERCDHCGWPLERGPGHWLGGSEVNMFLAFPFALLVFLPAGALFGFHLWTALLGFAAAACFSLWFLRRSRSLFYAVDYLLDPEAESEPDSDDGFRDVFDEISPGPVNPDRTAGSPTAPRRPSSTDPPR